MAGCAVWWPNSQPIQVVQNEWTMSFVTNIARGTMDNGHVMESISGTIVPLAMLVTNAK